MTSISSVSNVFWFKVVDLVFGACTGAYVLWNVSAYIVSNFLYTIVQEDNDWTNGQNIGHRLDKIVMKLDKWTNNWTNGQNADNSGQIAKTLDTPGFPAILSSFLSNFVQIGQVGGQKTWKPLIWLGLRVRLSIFCPLLDKRELRWKRLNTGLCEGFFFNFVHLSRISKL